ncbi:MAG: tail fiber protein [Alcanivorax sp.]|nr:tail fiber protein [Alcanivorax sp.]
MEEAFIGELRLFAFHTVPRGWMACNGQLLTINQYQALFSLLGTTYGGDGISTFALPNLQGRVPVHTGTEHGMLLGQSAGAMTHTLTGNEMPRHSHQVMADSAAATSAEPGNGLWAASASSPYAKPADNNPVTMASAAIADAGSDQPHNNMQPYLVTNFCIAVDGIFPSQSGSQDAGAFLGETRLFAGKFAPGGWSFCNGELLPIAQNTALFSLLGTTYGGDGRNTFALPDLRGQAPMHWGTGPGLTTRTLGDKVGVDAVPLQVAEMAAHGHQARAVSGPAETGQGPENACWAQSKLGRQTAELYGSGSTPTAMSEQALSAAGQGAPHNNMQPYLVLNFITSLTGLYPPRS